MFYTPAHLNSCCSFICQLRYKVCCVYRPHGFLTATQILFNPSSLFDTHDIKIRISIILVKISGDFHFNWEEFLANFDFTVFIELFLIRIRAATTSNQLNKMDKEHFEQNITESSSSESSFNLNSPDEYDVDYILGKRIRYGGVSIELDRIE